MDFSKIEWNKYTSESKKFIFEEGRKILSETVTSYREINNKSYTACAFYIGIFTYCWAEIVKGGFILPYAILMLGIIICIGIIYSNIMPTDFTLIGSSPNKLINPYYENFKNEEQIENYYIVQIPYLDSAIEKNKIKISERIKTFKNSIYFLIGSFVVSGLATVIGSCILNVCNVSVGSGGAVGFVPSVLFSSGI